MEDAVKLRTLDVEYWKKTELSISVRSLKV